MGSTTPTGLCAESILGLITHPNSKVRNLPSGSRVFSDLTLETTLPGPPRLKLQRQSAKRRAALKTLSTSRQMMVKMNSHGQQPGTEGTGCVFLHDDQWPRESMASLWKELVKFFHSSSLEADKNDHLTLRTWLVVSEVGQEAKKKKKMCPLAKILF